MSDSPQMQEDAVSEVRITVPYLRPTWGLWRRFLVWRKQRLSQEFPQELTGHVGATEYVNKIGQINTFLDKQQYLRWMALVIEIVEIIGLVTALVLMTNYIGVVVAYTKLMLIFGLIFHILAMNGIRLRRMKAQEEADALAKAWSSNIVKYHFDQKGIWLGYRLVVTIVIHTETPTFDPDPESLPLPPPTYTAEEPLPPIYTLQPPQHQYPPTVTSLPPPKRDSILSSSVTVTISNNNSHNS